MITLKLKSQLFLILFIGFSLTAFSQSKDKLTSPNNMQLSKFSMFNHNHEIIFDFLMEEVAIFEIEYSINGKVFKPVVSQSEEIITKNGNKNYYRLATEQKDMIYRIKKFDQSGNTSYTKPILFVGNMNGMAAAISDQNFIIRRGRSMGQLNLCLSK